MTVLKEYNNGTGTWVPVVSGVQGPTGPTGPTGPEPTNNGLTLIKTQSIGSGVSSVTVTSTFSSTYDNYLIAVSDITATSGGGVLYAKLCIGSTPQTSGWYGNTFYIAAGQAGSLSNATLTNSASVEICSLTSTTNHKNAGVANIQSPFLTQQTRLQYTNADDYYFRTGAFHLSNTTSYDGIQILPSSGTISGGTIRVYGYRN